ncbi:HEAT repeat domain-containing protein [Fulvivirga sedimenti]|uniref:HEAT repeat domain-containing protein n=1 Tax=Fulvivirga sedimenti TaxID=2879465 RepID=A0A9X1L0G0_9BACT|nr:HEAT repeat domain-containing protein [Fulvivirga sedimenti]MCA6074902.1 HEAT repeat domain-containing protein [Fulvivirga sedimenti]MCA6076079.1 HEAT repeat domain-containing protein [Fulvivirga sedimenti]MCA6077207.1 HEAT repeat domain-containing protein [Fulvivirga sedimenti]
MKSSVFGFLGIVLIAGCETKAPKETPYTIREDAETAVQRARDIEAATPVELYDGLNISLWASDSLAPDPIAMSIDDEGNVYLTRTNRQKNSEFDIRGHQDWMTASIALQSVADRREFLHQTFAPEKSNENEWLPDLNNDGSHDWKDLAVEEEEVWKLSDEDGDGVAEVSKRILSDFHDEITDVAGALLVRDKDVFVGVGPNMWRLEDTNDDEVLDSKTPISDGFAVHIGFGGHGMSGAVEGPDGRIYYGIGDIGADITTVDGRHLPHPNEGVIVRSEPDGSNFEVFAKGLRNTHEFVFDAYGNIISSDNDGDHPGESERLVHIVEGSDAGWRSNWQYGKYTDPKNNEYKVWMNERLFQPRWEGQAAYIIPPIQNYHNGPTGMIFNPGTALGKSWKDHFFLVEFVGNPSRSAIWAFTLKPEGASFKLEQEKKVISGILPTGIKFGPEGALYAADWINGWNTKNYGRVWKIDVDESANDLADERAETLRLMQLDYEDVDDNELSDLLGYADMRIRQKAQFELVRRQDSNALEEAIEQKTEQLKRIHGIWGLGQLGRQDVKYAAPLMEYLNDSDPEIIAQAAKVLGDVRYTEAGPVLTGLLKHENPRVRFYAAEGIGRIGNKEAIPELISMLHSNDDKDIYLRHAGVLALSRIGEVAPVVALKDSDSRALRIAAVLVLRRLADEQVALFLDDPDEYLVTEAARAINDDLSIEAALPALASILAETRFTSEPLLRRSINAALRVGGEKELNMLISFARRSDVDPVIRAEALATLGTWSSPSVLDRVDGRFRGVIERDPAIIQAKIIPVADEFLDAADTRVQIAAIDMLRGLNITDFNEQLAILMKSGASPEVRAASLESLHELNYSDMESLIRLGMNDADSRVRTAALGLLDEMDVSAEALPSIVRPVFQKGSLEEQQQLLKVLGKMPSEKSLPILETITDQLVAGKLDPSLTLDVFEAVETSEDPALMAKVEGLKSTDKTSVEAFQAALYGGDAGLGRQIFFYNATAQCTRCHVIRGEGSDVGPKLGGIASKLTREQLLEALIEPSARLAPGFGSVSLTLKDGQKVSGILMEENDTELILKTNEAEPLHIASERISERTNLPSSMPPMGLLLSQREIRDLLEFLSRLE